MDNFALQEIFNRIPLLKNWYLGSFPSDYVPAPDNDLFGYYQHATQQNAGWTFDHDCKFPT